MDAQPETTEKADWEVEVEWAITAPETEVGPACMSVRVPRTVDMTHAFREAYEQGYRHAMSDVRKVVGERLADE